MSAAAGFVVGFFIYDGLVAALAMTCIQVQFGSKIAR
jgi:hypothetical protein